MNFKVSPAFSKAAESRGAGVRWTPLPQAESPTEPTGETGAPGRAPQSAKYPCVSVFGIVNINRLSVSSAE